MNVCTLTGLRPGAFVQDAVEDFDLIEMLPLAFRTSVAGQ
jgi:hypothetical protein